MQLYSYFEILHFKSFTGGGGGISDAGKKIPYCLPVKVLGHTDLPFFIPAGHTAPHENIMFE